MKAGMGGPRMVVPKIPMNQDDGSAVSRQNRHFNSGSQNRQIIGQTTSPASQGEETAQNKTIESCDDEDFI